MQLLRVVCLMHRELITVYKLRQYCGCRHHAQGRVDVDHLLFILRSLLQLGEYASLCWMCFIHCTTRVVMAPNNRARPLLHNVSTILKFSGQVPIFVTLDLDALDKRPSTTGTLSTYEMVLAFMSDLILSNHHNLLKTRPEQDIQAVLNPLTSASTHVSLHEESGSKGGIGHYHQEKPQVLICVNLTNFNKF